MSQKQPSPPSFGRLARGLAADIRKVLKRFPVVLALLAATTLATITQIYNTWSNEQAATLRLFGVQITPFDLVFLVIISCLTGAAVALVAQLAAERARASQGMTSTQPVGGLVGSALMFAIALPTYSTHTTLLSMLCVAIAVCSVTLSLWLLMSPTNEGTLIPWFIRSALLAALITNVLWSGVLIVLEAYSALIHEADYQVFIAASCIVWLLVFPAIFMSQIPSFEQGLSLPKLWRTIVGYVVLPLVLVLLAILYVYIGRIALTRSFPSGEMNWFGSIALLVYLVLWLGLRDVDQPAVQLFVRWGWLLLVPVVVVQLMGVWIRLSAYGLTPLRLAALVCTGLGIVGLVLAALHARPRPLLLIASIAAGLALASPVNVVDVSNFAQAKRLEATLAATSLLSSDGSIDERAAAQLSDKDKTKIVGSWDYLRSADGAWFSPALPAGLEPELDLYGLLGVSPYDAYEQGEQDVQIGYMNIYNADRALPIEGWSWASPVMFEATSDESGHISVTVLTDGENLDDVVIPEDSLRLWIASLEQRYHIQYDEYNNDVQAPSAELTLTLDDNTQLVVNWVLVEYREGELYAINAEALLLQKTSSAA